MRFFPCLFLLSFLIFDLLLLSLSDLHLILIFIFLLFLRTPYAKGLRTKIGPQDIHPELRILKADKI